MDAREFVQMAASDVRERALINQQDGVLAAVSGGPDSVCLLLVLRDLAPNLGFTLHAAHFNHGIRESSEDDEAFVRDLCERVNVQLVTDRSASLGPDASEEEARNERLAYLQRAARETGCGFIATGHTADDLAETVLLNLIRGTGNGWLASGASGTFIRPLLGRRREDVLAYLHERGQPFRTDESNADITYARNRVRHRVLPMLENELGPHVRESLLRLAESAGEDSTLLDDLARELLQAAALPSSTSDALTLDSRALSGAPRPLALRAVRMGMGQLLGGLRDVSFQMCRRALQAAREPSAPCDIGLGLRAFSDPDTLTIVAEWEKIVRRVRRAPAETGELSLPEAAGWFVAQRPADALLSQTGPPSAIPEAGSPPARPKLRGRRIRPRASEARASSRISSRDAKLPRRAAHASAALLRRRCAVGAGLGLGVGQSSGRICSPAYGFLEFPQRSRTLCGHLRRACTMLRHPDPERCPCSFFAALQSLPLLLPPLCFLPHCRLPRPKPQHRRALPGRRR